MKRHARKDKKLIQKDKNAIGEKAKFIERRVAIRIFENELAA